MKDYDELRSFIKDSREFQNAMLEFKGQAMQALDNQSEHITAVSKKADMIRDGLDKHKDSPDAHGASVVSRNTGLIISVISVLIAAAAFTANLGRNNGAIAVSAPAVKAGR